MFSRHAHYNSSCCNRVIHQRSQEVRDNLANGHGSAGVLRGVEDLKVALQVLVDVEDGGDVTATVAVVGCGPNRHEVRVLEPVLEAVHDKLMSPSDELQVIDMVELSGDLGAEQPAGASRADSPSVDVLGIGPHQIAEGALVRHFHSALDQANLVKGLDLW